MMPTLERELTVADERGESAVVTMDDLVQVGDGPSDVAPALTLSRATHRKMIQNLASATG